MAKPLFLRKTVAAFKWRGKKFRNIRISLGIKTGNRSPIGSRNTEKFGKLFITSFPERKIQRGKVKYAVGISQTLFASPVGVSLRIIRPEKSQTAKEKKPLMAEARLGFEKDAVIIKELQGKRGQKTAFNYFKMVTGKPAMSYIVEQIEKQAKETGFEFVKIARPETTGWYERPYLDDHFTVEGARTTRQKIRTEMKALYYNLARKMGYKKEEKFLVKRL